MFYEMKYFKSVFNFFICSQFAAHSANFFAIAVLAFFSTDDQFAIRVWQNWFFWLSSTLNIAKFALASTLQATNKGFDSLSMEVIMFLSKLFQNTRRLLCKNKWLDFFQNMLLLPLRYLSVSGCSRRRHFQDIFWGPHKNYYKFIRLFHTVAARLRSLRTDSSCKKEHSRILYRLK